MNIPRQFTKTRCICVQHKICFVVPQFWNAGHNKTSHRSPIIYCTAAASIFWLRSILFLLSRASYSCTMAKTSFSSILVFSGRYRIKVCLSIKNIKAFSIWDAVKDNDLQLSRLSMIIQLLLKIKISFVAWLYISVASTVASHAWYVRNNKAALINGFWIFIKILLQPGLPIALQLTVVMRWPVIIAREFFPFVYGPERRTPTRL